MKQIYPINIDVFNTCLWVFFGTVEECAEALRAEKIEERHIKDWIMHLENIRISTPFVDLSDGFVRGAYSYNSEANVSLLWLSEIPLTVSGYGTLVHEIEHFVFSLFDRLGMEHTDASDEAYAYMMGHTFREIDNIIVTLREEADGQDNDTRQDTQQGKLL